MYSHSLPMVAHGSPIVSVVSEQREKQRHRDSNQGANAVSDHGSNPNVAVQSLRSVTGTMYSRSLPMVLRGSPNVAVQSLDRFTVCYI